MPRNGVNGPAPEHRRPTPPPPPRKLPTPQTMPRTLDVNAAADPWFFNVPVGSTMTFSFDDASFIYEKQCDGSWIRVEHEPPIRWIDIEESNDDAEHSQAAQAPAQAQAGPEVAATTEGQGEVRSHHVDV